MKFSRETVAESNMILANDHFTAVPYDCSDVTADEDGVIKAGTIIPSNDSSAEGVLLHDVVLDKNPNGAIVTHGTIVTAKLPEEPTAAAETALKGVVFLSDANGGSSE